MAYTLSKRASGASNLTAKNRVWDFFENSNRTRPANRREALKLRRKNRPTLTKTASGIPVWPSRDPIEEEGGVNLYAYCFNTPKNYIDRLGMSPILVAILLWKDDEKGEAIIDELTGKRTYGPLPQSAAGEPSGELDPLASPCPAGEWPLQVVHSQKSGNLWHGDSSIELKFKGSYSNGSAEGTLSAGGKGINARIGYHVIGVDIHKFTKPFKCDCWENVGCVRFTIVIRTVIDQPFLFWNEDYTTTVTVEACGDGNATISTL
jgi:hypothetical protein